MSGLAKKLDSMKPFCGKRFVPCVDILLIKTKKPSQSIDYKGVLFHSVIPLEQMSDQELEDLKILANLKLLIDKS